MVMARVRNLALKLFHQQAGFIPALKNLRRGASSGSNRAAGCCRKAAEEKLSPSSSSSLRQ
jgi:hypothetical protein